MKAQLGIAASWVLFLSMQHSFAGATAQTPGDFLDVFASEVALTFPTGIAEGPDGNIYVSGATSRNVVRFDGETGAFLNQFSEIFPLFPERVAFGPDGNLYVAADTRVLRYDGISGEFLDDFVADATGSVRDIEFGPDGRLYMTLAFFTARVVVFDGTSVVDFVPAGTFGIAGIEGMTFGPAGDLYLSESTGVLRFSGTSGELVEVFVPPGGALSAAVDLTFGTDGHLYVVDGNRIVRFNGLNGDFIDVFGESDEPLRTLAFGAGRLLATGSTDVLAFNPVDGAAEGVFASKEGLASPIGLGFAPSGNLFASSLGWGVVSFDGESGAFQGTSGPESMWGLTVGPDGNVYAGATLGSIVRFDGVTGGLLGTFVEADPFPLALAFGPGGDLYVANLGLFPEGGIVRRFSGSTGALVYRAVIPGAARSLTFGPDGDLYVGTSNSVFRLNPATGTVIDTFVEAPGFFFRNAIVIGPNGDLFLTTTADSVARFDGDTGAFLDHFVSPGAGGLSLPEGLTFGPDGDFYVSSAGTNEVLRFEGPARSRPAPVALPDRVPALPDRVPLGIGPPPGAGPPVAPGPPSP